MLPIKVLVWQGKDLFSKRAKMRYTETVIDKNHPVDIWDF